MWRVRTGGEGGWVRVRVKGRPRIVVLEGQGEKPGRGPVQRAWRAIRKVADPTPHPHPSRRLLHLLPKRPIKTRNKSCILLGPPPRCGRNSWQRRPRRPRLRLISSDSDVPCAFFLVYAWHGVCGSVDCPSVTSADEVKMIVDHNYSAIRTCACHAWMGISCIVPVLRDAMTLSSVEINCWDEVFSCNTSFSSPRL